MPAEPAPPPAPVRSGCPGSGTGGARSSAARRRPARRCSCRMSPTGGMPSSVAQHARRAAVVGDGDDRGQVAGVLLEAAQERRQAGPAADRHDPRAAGEEPLLVDELDERLVGVGRPERVRQGPDDAGTAPTTTSADPDRRRRSGRAAANGRNWSVSRSMTRRASPPGSRSRRDLAEEVGERRGRAAASPAKTTSSQRLTPMPGRQPAPQVHVRSSSRWKTATGPKSCSRSQRGELLGDDDRAVIAAGAADARSSGASCPRRRRPGCANVEELVEERRGTGRRRAGRGRTSRTASVRPDSWRSSAT